MSVLGGSQRVPTGQLSRPALTGHVTHRSSLWTMSTTAVWRIYRAPRRRLFESFSAARSRIRRPRETCSWKMSFLSCGDTVGTNTTSTFRYAQLVCTCIDTDVADEQVEVETLDETSCVKTTMIAGGWHALGSAGGSQHWPQHQWTLPQRDQIVQRIVYWSHVRGRFLVRVNMIDPYD